MKHLVCFRQLQTTLRHIEETVELGLQQNEKQSHVFQHYDKKHSSEYWIVWAFVACLVSCSVMWIHFVSVNHNMVWFSNVAFVCNRFLVWFHQATQRLEMFFGIFSGWKRIICPKNPIYINAGRNNLRSRNKVSQLILWCIMLSNNASWRTKPNSWRLSKYNSERFFHYSQLLHWLWIQGIDFQKHQHTQGSMLGLLLFSSMVAVFFCCLEHFSFVSRIKEQEQGVPQILYWLLLLYR